MIPILNPEQQTLEDSTMTADLPYVVAIILNTNRREDTLECLRSVTKSTYQNLGIVVLDNASTDGSVEAIQGEFPDVQLERLTQNKGYTGNNNVGFELAIKQGADWILVLNEDLTLSPDGIELMVRKGDEDLTVGVVGPLVYHYDEPKVIQSAGAIMDKHWRSRHIGENETDSGQFSQPRTVDWISGCAILFRRSVIEQVGGFEEKFFYYNEEVDLCFRARQAGWKVLFVPEAKCWHKGVQRNYRPSPNITYYSVRNQFLFLKKQSAPLSVRLYNWFDFLRTIASWTLKPKWGFMRPHRDAALQAMSDYLRGKDGRRQ